MGRNGMLIGLACVAAAVVWLVRQTADPLAPAVELTPAETPVDVSPQVNRILHTIETDAPWILAANAKSSTKS